MSQVQFAVEVTVVLSKQDAEKLALNAGYHNPCYIQGWPTGWRGVQDASIHHVRETEVGVALTSPLMTADADGMRELRKTVQRLYAAKVNPTCAVRVFFPTPQENGQVLYVHELAQIVADVTFTFVTLGEYDDVRPMRLTDPAFFRVHTMRPAKSDLMEFRSKFEYHS